MDNNKTKTIKICFVCPKAYPLFNPTVKKVFGGAELDLYILARELAKDANYNVSCVVADYGQDDVEIIDRVKIIKSLDFNKNSLSGAIKIWYAMKQAEADIYFQESSGPGTFLVALFCKVHGHKFVYRTAHKNEVDGKFLRSSPLVGKGFQWALRQAAQVIVQNQEDRILAHKSIDVDSEVINNAHELYQPTEISRDIILWVGRSAPFKRPRLCLKLAKQIPDEKFVMICQHATGDNDYDDLKKEAGEISNLQFVEHVPFRDIINYFSRAKIYVNTSESEGFANTFVDACKSGTPVLSLVVNPDNFLDKNKCGLCAEGDWQKFIDDVKLLSKSETAREYGQNGLEYVRKNHDIKIVVMEYKKLFENLLGLS